MPSGLPRRDVRPCRHVRSTLSLRGRTYGRARCFVESWSRRQSKWKEELDEMTCKSQYQRLLPTRPRPKNESRDRLLAAVDDLMAVIDVSLDEAAGGPGPVAA